MKPLMLAIVFSSVAIMTVAAQENSVSRQFENAPMDPAFLYEERFIPGNEAGRKAVDVPKSSDREEVVKLSEEDKKKYKLSIKLPNFAQSLAVAAVIIVFILYRIQVSRRGRNRRN